LSVGNPQRAHRLAEAAMAVKLPLSCRDWLAACRTKRSTDRQAAEEDILRIIAAMSLLAILFSAAGPSLAQPAPAPGPNAAESDQDNPPVPAESKRRACRQDGTAQGLHGPDLQDYAAVCVMEARLGCLKQAVAQHVRGPGRKEFITKCMGS